MLIGDFDNPPGPAVPDEFPNGPDPDFGPEPPPPNPGDWRPHD